MNHNFWQPTDRAYAKRRSADPQDIGNMSKAILLQMLPEENAMFNEARARFAVFYAHARQYGLTDGMVFALSPDTPPRDEVTIPRSKSITLSKLVDEVATARSGCKT